jgi:hypothetical protein
VIFSGFNILVVLVIWNASSSHKRALGPFEGERLWRMQV